MDLDGIGDDLGISKHLSGHSTNQITVPNDNDLSTFEAPKHTGVHVGAPASNVNFDEDADIVEAVGDSKHEGVHANTEEDIEDIQEMNHQEEFDKNALKHEKQLTQAVQAGNSVGSSYLETLEGLDVQPQSRKLNAENQHAVKSPLDDMLSEIKKQDAIDQQYDKHYYKSNDVTVPEGNMPGGELFSDAVNYEEVTGEKKWLKSQHKSKRTN